MGLIYLAGNSILEYELWRYLTYSLVHRLALHLVCVLSVQLTIGVMMETVHGGVAMGLIYLAGVVSGSLASFLLDPGLNLAGGSSGCYALLGAATASLVLNWHEDHAIVIRRLRTSRPATVIHGKLVRLLKLVFLGTFVTVDLVLALASPGPGSGSISVVAHVFGLVGGLLAGLLLTTDRRERSWEAGLKTAARATTATYFAALAIANVIRAA